MPDFWHQSVAAEKATTSGVGAKKQHFLLLLPRWPTENPAFCRQMSTHRKSVKVTPSPRREIVMMIVANVLHGNDD